jgi:hypothetical protein
VPIPTSAWRCDNHPGDGDDIVVTLDDGRISRPTDMRQILYLIVASADVALWIAFSIGVVLDVVSCVTFINIRKNGHGPSGVPIVSLLFYIYRIFIRPLDPHRPFVELHRSLALAAVAIFFHVSMQFLIPCLVVRKAVPPSRHRR